MGFQFCGRRERTRVARPRPNWLMAARPAFSRRASTTGPNSPVTLPAAYQPKGRQHKLLGCDDLERGFARVCALPEVYEGIVVRLDAFSPPQHCEIIYSTPPIRTFKTIGEAAPLPPATNEGLIE